jgi:hypothetical protein
MTNSEDSLDKPVWGANKIAEVINRSPRSTFHLLEKGYIDADKVGHQWVSTRRRLLWRIARIDGAK